MTMYDIVNLDKVKANGRDREVIIAFIDCVRLECELKRLRSEGLHVEGIIHRADERPKRRRINPPPKNFESASKCESLPITFPDWSRS